MCPVDKNLYASSISMLLPIFLALRASIHWKVKRAVLLTTAFLGTTVLGTLSYAYICQYELFTSLRVGVTNGLIIVVIVYFGFLIRNRSGGGNR